MIWLSSWLLPFFGGGAGGQNGNNLEYKLTYPYTRQSILVNGDAPTWLHLTNLTAGVPVEFRLARSSPISPGEMDVTLWQPEENPVMALLRPRGSPGQVHRDTERLLLHPRQSSLWLQVAFRCTGFTLGDKSGQVELGVIVERQLQHYGIPASTIQMLTIMIGALAAFLLLGLALLPISTDNGKASGEEQRSKAGGRSQAGGQSEAGGWSKNASLSASPSTQSIRSRPAVGSPLRRK